MQILASYDSTTDRLQLHYDPEAQIVFGKAHAATRSVCRMRHIQEILGEKCRVIQARLFIGNDLLRQLAENSTRQIDVSSLDLQTSIEAVMFAAHYRIESGKPDPSLPNAIMLLAQVTPFPVPPLPLPPASEVFDKGKVAVAVLHSYESIRQSKDRALQGLVLLDHYELWRALAEIQPVNSQLRGLLHILDHSTGMFRATMQAQAVAAVEAMNPKTKRQRKKL